MGVAVVIWRDTDRSHLLIGQGHRRGDRGAVYALPGGSWEVGESLADAAHREVSEEAGVAVAGLSLVSVYEFVDENLDETFVTIGFTAILAAGTPTVQEPDRKLSWSWQDPAKAQQLPLFEPDGILILRASAAASVPVYEIDSSR